MKIFMAVLILGSVASSQALFFDLFKKEAQADPWTAGAWAQPADPWSQQPQPASPWPKPSIKPVIKEVPIYIPYPKLEPVQFVKPFPVFKPEFVTEPKLSLPSKFFNFNANLEAQRQQYQQAQQQQYQEALQQYQLAQQQQYHQYQLAQQHQQAQQAQQHQQLQHQQAQQAQHSISSISSNSIPNITSPLPVRQPRTRHLKHTITNLRWVSSRLSQSVGGGEVPARRFLAVLFIYLLSKLNELESADQ
nr:myb-like protein Q [Penaeus vannamei]